MTDVILFSSSLKYCFVINKVLAVDKSVFLVYVVIIAAYFNTLKLGQWNESMSEDKVRVSVIIEFSLSAQSYPGFVRCVKTNFNARLS